ncbi:MAG TPA: hypothetical protein VFD58_28935 [Blastocatellia bacterium]|nr:hypothetical protein [Blastocatellia bacterium]
MMFRTYVSRTTRRQWLIFSVISFALLSAVILLLYLAIPDLSPFYGIVSITGPGGREIYFKKVVWGITGDHEITAISVKAELCNLRDAKTDYVFGWYTNGVWYKVEGDALVLYVSSAATLPKDGQFPIRVIQKELHPLEFSELERNANKLGLKFIDVPLNKGQYCSR